MCMMCSEFESEMFEYESHDGENLWGWIHEDGLVVLMDKSEMRSGGFRINFCPFCGKELANSVHGDKTYEWWSLNESPYDIKAKNDADRSK